jgi:hypothetical protein
LLASVRLLLAIEEHGGGKQLVRMRVWPRIAPFAVAIFAVLAILALEAGRERLWAIAAFLGLLAALHGTRMLYEAAVATGDTVRSFERLASTEA